MPRGFVFIDDGKGVGMLGVGVRVEAWGWYYLALLSGLMF